MSAVITAAVTTALASVGLDAAQAAPALAPFTGPPPRSDAPPATCYELGGLYEQARDQASRRATGAYFTPRPVVDRLLHLAIKRPQGSILDPSCGGGAFVLGAADRLLELGVAPEDAVEMVAGIDIDPVAVGVSQAALALWAEAHGTVSNPARVVLGDGLDASEVVASEGLGPVGAVVGNPPFLGQLSRATARRAEDRERLLERFGDSARGYVDTSALFLLAALDAVEPGGVVVLIQPESLLAARDAAPVRKAVESRATLDQLWLGGPDVFEAGTRVCAPILRRDGPHGEPVTLWSGPLVEGPGDRLGYRPGQPTWSYLARRVNGVPEVNVESDRVLGDVATLTADFRDQYYGLQPAVFDAEGQLDGEANGPWRLVTTGLVDPAVCLWGRVPARFAKQKFARPVIDLDRLSGEMRAWAASRLVPKVLVASQTKVIECWVDEEGSALPVTPLVVATPRRGAAEAPPDVFAIAAVVGSPVATAWAATNYAGAALASDALKVSARQMSELPLPADAGPWREAAAAWRAATAESSPEAARGHLMSAGRLMADAYRLPDPEPLLRWWHARLPQVR